MKPELKWVLGDHVIKADARPVSYTHERLVELEHMMDKLQEALK